jgi:peptidyl-prolyl cis-trans isomerase SurA
MFAADATVVEQIIAKVNGDIITQSDLLRERASTKEDLQRQGITGTSLDDAVKEQIPNLLRQRIDRLLLIQKAKDLDLKVDPDVNKELARIQRETKITDTDKFQQLVRQETGKSYEDYRSDLKDQFMIQGVIREEVLRKITFKTEELRDYYNAHQDQFQRDERVLLREILVSTQGKENDPVAMAAAEKKANDLVARARKGEVFADLAQNNSDSVSAQQGGALDPYTKGQLSKQLEDAVWDKERGYITDPIKVSSGYLILKVDEHHKAGLADFEEVQGAIQNYLLGTRQEAALRAYLTKLREEAFLEIKPGYVDTGAAPGKDTAWTDPALLKPQTITREEVEAKGTHRRLLGIIPLPGTTTHTGTSSSR